jgi:outer membrane lipoprotein LolB
VRYFGTERFGGITRLGLAAALAVVLAACASPPRAPADMPVLAGRLSMQVAAHATEPARGFSGEFDLRGTAQTGGLVISGPLGVSVVRASWAAGQYRLENNQQTLEFSSLEELSRAGLGEVLPLGALFDWLRGRPWPAAAHQPLTDGVSGFEQLGWRIETVDIASGRLRAARQQPPAITLRVQLDSSAGP